MVRKMHLPEPILKSIHSCLETISKQSEDRLDKWFPPRLLRKFRKIDITVELLMQILLKTIMLQKTSVQDKWQPVAAVFLPAALPQILLRNIQTYRLYKPY